MLLQGKQLERPAHVPESRVRNYPIINGTRTTLHPFNDVMRHMHDYPPVFYAMKFLAAIPAFTLRPNAVLEFALGSVSQPINLPLVWSPQT